MESTEREKGTDIADSHTPVIHSFCTHFREKDYSGRYDYKSNILSCTEEEAPSRKDETVQDVGRLEGTWDPASAVDRTGADGESYKEFTFALRMTVIGTAIEFSTSLGGSNEVSTRVDVELGDW